MSGVSEEAGALYVRDLGTGGKELPAGFDSLVVLGGPMSANDPLPGLQHELRLIDHALTQNLPILGVCLGAQLIAKSLGGAGIPESQIWRSAGRRFMSRTPDAADLSCLAAFRRPFTDVLSLARRDFRSAEFRSRVARVLPKRPGIRAFRYRQERVWTAVSASRK